MGKSKDTELSLYLFLSIQLNEMLKIWKQTPMQHILIAEGKLTFFLSQLESYRYFISAFILNFFSLL